MIFGTLNFVVVILALQTSAALESDSRPSSGVEAARPQDDGGYVLGVADKIKVVVFEEAALSGEFRIAANGDIAFPLLGPIKASGLSPEQLEASIRASLDKGYIHDARVNVEVVTFRPYFILGEVGRPGEYPYSAGLTALNAVATAGGFTYRANTHRVFIKRRLESQEHPEALTPSTKLAPGDTLRIAERWF